MSPRSSLFEDIFASAYETLTELIRSYEGLTLETSSARDEASHWITSKGDTSVNRPLVQPLRSKRDFWVRGRNHNIYSSKGQCPDYAHARTSSVFSYKDNRTVMLTGQDFLADRTGNGELLFTFSSNILDFRRSLSFYLIFGSRNKYFPRFCHLLGGGCLVSPHVT